MSFYGLILTISVIHSLWGIWKYLQITEYSRLTAPECSTTRLDSQGWTPHFPSTRWPPCSPFLSDLPKIEACTTINFWDAAIDDHLARPIVFINLDFITQNRLTISPYTTFFLNLESTTQSGVIVSPYYVLGCDDLLRFRDPVHDMVGLKRGKLKSLDGGYIREHWRSFELQMHGLHEWGGRYFYFEANTWITCSSKSHSPFLCQSHLNLNSLLHLHKSPSTEYPQESPQNALPPPPRSPPNHPCSSQRPLHRQLQTPPWSRFLAGRRNLHPHLDLQISRRRLRLRLVSRRSRGYKVLLCEHVWQEPWGRV